MREIKITNNESDQRLDRFIRKLLGEASLGFIYKQIRKKNITVNKEKSNEKYILKEGDLVQIYFSDETIDNFKTKKEKIKSNVKLDIVYEDENILIINKRAGLLSHSTKKDYSEDNVVDAMLAYLNNKDEYDPKDSATFTPSLANRLDRNTSGLLIGAKTYNAIQELNKAQRNNQIDKFYYTIVSGSVDGEKTEYANIEKVNNKENLSKVSKEESEDKKTIITAYKSILKGKKYSLLEINLITGRTHQIRAHLGYLNMPVIGDTKYGNKKTNKFFKDKYNLNHQLLHCYKTEFLNLEGDLEYLSNRTFEVDKTNLMNEIIKGEIE